MSAQDLLNSVVNGSSPQSPCLNKFTLKARCFRAFYFTVMKRQNLRTMAAQAVEQVIEQGQSLSNVLPALQQKVSDKDKALLQELCFGVLRTLSA